MTVTTTGAFFASATRYKAVCVRDASGAIMGGRSAKRQVAVAGRIPHSLPASDGSGVGDERGRWRAPEATKAQHDDGRPVHDRLDGVRRRVPLRLLVGGRCDRRRGDVLRRLVVLHHGVVRPAGAKSEPGYGRVRVQPRRRTAARSSACLAAPQQDVARGRHPVPRHPLLQRVHVLGHVARTDVDSIRPGRVAAGLLRFHPLSRLQHLRHPGLGQTPVVASGCGRLAHRLAQHDRVHRLHGLCRGGVRAAENWAIRSTSLLPTGVRWSARSASSWGPCSRSRPGGGRRASRPRKWLRPASELAGIADDAGDG